jgi:hypothetical protein
MLLKLPKFTPLPPFSLKYTARTWCALVALITALAFISLVSTAVTHYHTSAQETQDCSVCSVVSHKIGGGFAVPKLNVTQFFVLFALAVITLRSTFYSTSELFPPSCGPPGTV